MDLQGLGILQPRYKTAQDGLHDAPHLDDRWRPGLSHCIRASRDDAQWSLAASCWLKFEHASLNARHSDWYALNLSARSGAEQLAQTHAGTCPRVCSAVLLTHTHSHAHT